MVWDLLKINWLINRNFSYKEPFTNLFKNAVN